MKKTNKSNILAIAMLVLYFLVCVLLLVWCKFFLDPADTMGFTVLGLYISAPLAALLCTLFTAMSHSPAKWAMPLLFGCGELMLSILCFGGELQWLGFFLSFVPSVVGLILGLIVRGKKQKKNATKAEQQQ